MGGEGGERLLTPKGWEEMTFEMSPKVSVELIGGDGGQTFQAGLMAGAKKQEKFMAYVCNRKRDTWEEIKA